MKTILHLTQAAGGVEVYLDLLLKNSNKKKYRNILVASSNYSAEACKDLADEFITFEIARSVNPITALNELRLFRKILKEKNPDILYCHSTFAGFIGRLVAIGTKVKVIYNPHGWSFNMKVNLIQRLVFTAIERFLAHFTDKIICISDFEKKSALKFHIAPEQKMVTIFNGVDTKGIEEKTKVARNIDGVPEDAYVVGMIGRISSQKAPDTFVNMAALIKKAIPNAFFIIVGDGRLREQIQKQIDSLNLTNSFLITGWIKDTQTYLSRFNVGVLLSRWEGFGLAAVEYMAAKKPIVCTYADALPDLVENNNNGLLVNIDDYKAAADAVIKIYKDKTLSDKLAENAYTTAQNRFDISRVLIETDKLITEICS